MNAPVAQDDASWMVRLDADVGMTVAVTGPTGEIGRPTIAALEREAGIDRIIGMARRPCDPRGSGWLKTEYRQGDVLDRSAVAALVRDADVVVHLAFAIMGTRKVSRRVNLDGTRNVVEATVQAQRPTRLVFTSSIAAYGFHTDNPNPLTEAVPARGSDEHYYSQQKAQCEALIAAATAGSGLEVYVLRPCIVAGPTATALSDLMPWQQVGNRLPRSLSRAVAAIPGLRPVLPDPGVRLQLVHHDDVASAIVAAVVGRGTPGAYNVAADGDVSLAQVAAAIGARSLPVPHALVGAAAGALTHLPFAPAVLEWIHTMRTPMIMDTSKARRELGWRPAYTSEQALESMAQALRRRA